jgi:hypothetical protein
MTLAEAGDIFDYWREHPPVHLMVEIVARMLGWKPPAAPVADDTAPLAPPPGIVVARAGLGMPAPQLDLETMQARNRALAAARR